MLKSLSAGIQDDSIIKRLAKQIGLTSSRGKEEGATRISGACGVGKEGKGAFIWGSESACANRAIHKKSVT